MIKEAVNRDQCHSGEDYVQRRIVTVTINNYTPV